MIQIGKNIISVNGNDFEYAVMGTKSPAIILINGAGGPIEGWLKIWQELGRENVVFAYNRLGIGRSSKPKEPQTGIVMVKDLKELLLSLTKRAEVPHLKAQIRWGMDSTQTEMLTNIYSHSIIELYYA